MSASSEQSREVLEQARRVASQAVLGQVRLSRRSAELVAATLRGTTTPVGAARDYLDALATEAVGYGRSLGELGSAVATVVLGSAARSGATPAPPDAGAYVATGTETGTGATVAAITLHGSPGGSAGGAVTVVNRHPRPRRITLQAEPLRAAAEDASPLVLSVHPQSATVPAGEELVVRLTVDLPVGVAAPGETYRAMLRVSGGDEATVDVTLTVARA